VGQPVVFPTPTLLPLLRPPYRPVPGYAPSQRYGVRRRSVPLGYQGEVAEQWARGRESRVRGRQLPDLPVQLRPVKDRRSWVPIWFITTGWSIRHLEVQIVSCPVIKLLSPPCSLPNRVHLGSHRRIEPPYLVVRPPMVWKVN
jgi:hypothetical protein